MKILDEHSSNIALLAYCSSYTNYSHLNPKPDLVQISLGNTLPFQAQKITQYLQEIFSRGVLTAKSLLKYVCIHEVIESLWMYVNIIEIQGKFQWKGVRVISKANVMEEIYKRLIRNIMEFIVVRKYLSNIRFPGDGLFSNISWRLQRMTKVSERITHKVIKN